MAINLQVGADVNQATAELNKLSAAVASFGGGVQKFTPVITNFASQLSRVTPAVQKITPVSNMAVDAMGKLRKTSDQAGQALSNLGRVAQDAPFGFIAIQNNLNPLLESFQRLRAGTDSNAAAFKALGSSLLGAGGIGFALSVLSSLYLKFGDSLFSGVTVRFKEAELAAADFANDLKRVQDALSDLKEDLDFGNKIQKLNNELKGLEGFSLDKANAAVDAKGRRGLDAFLTAQIELIQEKLPKFKEKVKNVRDAQDALFEATKGTRFATDQRGDGLIGLLDRFGKIEDVPTDLIDKLKDKEKEFATEYKTNTEELNKFIKQRDANTRAGVVGDLELKVKQVEETKKLNEKAIEDQKQFVNDTIAQAKKLSDFTKDIISLKLDIGFFDKLPQQFAKSLQFLNKFNAGQFKLIVPIVPVLDTALPEAKQAVNNFAEFFQEEIKKATGTLKLDDGTVTDFGLLNAIENGKLREKLVAAFARFGQSLPPIDFSLNPGDFQKKMADALEAVTKKFEIASIAAKAASGAFSTAFDALVNGDNAVQALGQALQQLVLEFIKAAIAGLILKAVTNLILPGAGSVGSGAAAGLIGSLSGFRAAGGPVGAGGSYVVGEKGPELFVPRTSGTIISNNDLKSGTGMAAGFSGGGAIVLTPVLRGDQIRLQQSRTARRQNRTV